MTGRKFIVVIGMVFLVALIVYFTTTPRGSDISLIGIVDGNEVIVSPQIMGRIINLTVDEGSAVKKGDLIAELDRTELEASLAAAKANVATLENSVHEAEHNYSWTSEQTSASLDQAQAMTTSSSAQLDQARAQLWRDQADLKRMQQLYDKREVSAQDRDHAEAAVRMSESNVKALEDALKAQHASIAVAQANRKQVDVRKSAIASTIAQLEQARAAEAQTTAQLSYTRIYAPIDGIVSVRVAKQGEVVSPGSPIVVVVDVDHLWVRADVEESYIDSIQFGEKMRVKLPSGNVIEGPVIFKGVENDFATQRDVSRTKRDIKTFAIKVSVPNPEHRLFTGMTATVLLPQPQKKNWLERLRT
ncbi:MAG TPA: efflux RND transporter periplasmic adaptor subunit [Candidatus Acidoferrales bacterium]|jgi:HlyD family secretion protein|nr:efflux RND transporter periplasmic adaptor subunit [Candidatus Acidoferrales bacterium]